jgi:hypothetical protein
VKKFRKEQEHRIRQLTGQGAKAQRETKQLFFATFAPWRLGVQCFSIFSQLQMPVLRLAQAALQLCLAGSTGFLRRDINQQSPTRGECKGEG